MLSTVLKTLFMYVFVLFVTRLMGKREIGQLSPFDLVVAIMIADLAATPLEEKSIHIHDAVIPIAVLAFLEVVFAFVTLKSEKARKLISGQPSIVVRNGNILEGTLRELRYNIDDLLSGLREKGIPNIQDVEFAILEASGRLSVIPKSQVRPAVSYTHLLETLDREDVAELAREGQLKKINGIGVAIEDKVCLLYTSQTILYFFKRKNIFLISVFRRGYVL